MCQQDYGEYYINYILSYGMLDLNYIVFLKKI